MGEFHSNYSGSKAKIINQCQAGVALSLHLKLGSKPNAASEEGTKAHDILEKILRKKDMTYFGKDLDKDLPDDMMTSVLVAVHYIYEVNMLDTYQMDLERRVFIKHKDLDISGSADIILHNEDEIIVVDYKHGIGVDVDVYKNDQLFFYTAGALESYPEREFKKVSFVIIQPRSFSNPEAVRIYETSVEEVLDWKSNFLENVDRVEYLLDKLNNKKNYREIAQYFNVGKDGEACRFCPFRQTCLARVKKVNEIVGVNIMKDTPKEIITTVDLEQVNEWIPFLRAFTKDMSDALLTAVELGLMHTDKYTVEESKGNRIYSSSNEQVKDYLLACGISEDLILEPAELKSPAKIEKAAKGNEKFDKNIFESFTTRLITGKKLKKLY